MKKILVLIISLFSFISVNYAVSNVNYKIDDYIVDSRIDISGNMVVREVIKVKGSFNGYIRDLKYKNSNNKVFDKSIDSFYGSSIYDASNIEVRKVGTINYDKELDFNVFDQSVNEFTMNDSCTVNKGCYEKSDITDGVSLKMYNETNNSSTYFYIEYLLGNVVVMHEDIAEVYFNFVGDMFDDDINKYKLRVVLPDKTKELVRVWAHGPLNGNVSPIKDENGYYYGGYLEINDLYSNTPVDMRLTFDKNLILVDHPYLKKSEVLALDKILEVENLRADKANKEREKAKFFMYGSYALGSVYLVLLVLLFAYIYIKYDKELKTNFDMEYNREFINDYDVTNIEYLFDKKITEKAFSTSILNLIYKKNIKIEQIDKKDYKLIKVNTDNVSESEEYLMKMIFDNIGNKEYVLLSQIKKYAKEIHGTTSEFLTSFTTWQNKVTSESIKNNFYESNTKIKVLGVLFSLVGYLVFYVMVRFNGFNLFSIIIFICALVFMIYMLIFNKRTKRGAEDYQKWKAFKRFLEDFGRFDEKELPEIVLWERYLVYANIFGIADKVGKTMKIKFNEINTNNQYSNGDLLFDYMMWNNLNHSINNTVRSSVSTARTVVNEAIAKSSSSSGGGFGGGFSSGGGFGGGGGGGRGF
jgi:uncharacterized membrane protein